MTRVIAAFSSRMMTEGGMVTAPEMRSFCPAKASFAKEIIVAEHGDDCFFSLLRNDDDLHPPFLDIENSIGRVALRKDARVLWVLANGPAVANLGEK